MKQQEIDPKKFNVFFNKVFNKVNVCDDVWLTSKSEKHRLGHPTERPVELFRRVIMAPPRQETLFLIRSEGREQQPWLVSRRKGNSSSSS